MSLMLSMALRFVPHFMAQLKVIRNGQKCVGMDVSNGKWFKKIRYAFKYGVHSCHMGTGKCD